MTRFIRPGAAAAAAMSSVLIVGLASACSPSGPDASSATSPEQEVVVYSGRSEELVGPLFAQFTEQTGIPLQVRYGESAELAAQLIEEGDRTPAQVYFSQDAGALGAVSAAGLLAPLPDEVAQAVPAAYRATDGTWTGVTGRARVIAYDADQVAAEDVPTSVFELVDPKWRGQVAIAPTNASFQSFVTAMRLTEGEQRTQEWLAGLVANDVQTFEKNGLILDAVDTGQVALGLINHYYWFEKAKEVGPQAMRAKLAFTASGDPGSLVNVAGVGLTTAAGRSPAAEGFISWLLSPDVQQWFADNTSEYPLLPGVPAPEGTKPLAELRGPDVTLAQLADLPATLEMLARVGLL